MKVALWAPPKSLAKRGGTIGELTTSEAEQAEPNERQMNPYNLTRSDRLLSYIVSLASEPGRAGRLGAALAIINDLRKSLPLEWRGTSYRLTAGRDFCHRSAYFSRQVSKVELVWAAARFRDDNGSIK